jgi:acyl-CoA synthetase (AMP-forming)/AMP-acid ligase II
MEAKIILVKDGRELNENKRGELCPRCPNMMLGYLNKPKESIPSLSLPLSPPFFTLLLLFANGRYFNE